VGADGLVQEVRQVPRLEDPLADGGVRDAQQASSSSARSLWPEASIFSMARYCRGNVAARTGQPMSDSSAPTKAGSARLLTEQVAIRRAATDVVRLRRQKAGKSNSVAPILSHAPIRLNDRASIRVPRMPIRTSASGRLTMGFGAP